MTEATHPAETSASSGLFRPFTEAQSYLNLFYLLLSFPLGIFYFVFLVTGLSVGVSLLIVWVGIPILMAVILAWWGMSAFERQMAIRLLNVPIPPMTRESEPVSGLWPRFKALLTNPVTWKGLAYLMARFPLGIFSFVVVVTLVSLSLGLLLAPLAIAIDPLMIGGWRLDTLSEALVGSVMGALLGVLSLHITNWLAYSYGQFARLMLGDFNAIAGLEPGYKPAPISFDARGKQLAGVILVGLGAFSLVSMFLEDVGRFLVPVVLIAIGVAAIIPRKDSEAQDEATA